MSRSTAFLTRAATVLGVCALVAAGAQVSGAKTKGTPTSGSAFLADTHTVGHKVFAAGSGNDKLLGPAAITLVFSSTKPTHTPGVVDVTAKPMTIWLRQGIMVGSATVLVNMNTGAVTGHARFTGRTGTLRGHTLVVPSFRGTADLATGRFHYTYRATYF